MQARTQIGDDETRDVIGDEGLENIVQLTISVVAANVRISLNVFGVIKKFVNQFYNNT